MDHEPHTEDHPNRYGNPSLPALAIQQFKHVDSFRKIVPTSPNIIISRIFSAHFLGLPLISAANAEEQSAFFGYSPEKNRRFSKGRKAIFPTDAAAQGARSCVRCARVRSIESSRSQGRALASTCDSCPTRAALRFAITPAPARWRFARVCPN